ncbi:MAG: hypothetical protein RR234_10435, partial [Christensenella sp.]
KAELGADLCAKIEAWAAALATKPVLVANKAAAPKSLTNVWVQQGATGDGSSPDRATASLLDAYNKVAENGTIHVIGTVPVNSADVIAGLNKTVTIQSATGATGVLKRNSGNAETLITIAANGNLTIKNVAIDGGAMYNGGVVSRAGATTPPCGVYTQTSGKGQLIWVLPNGSFTLGDKGVLCNNAIVGASYTIGNAFHFGSAIYTEGNVTIEPGSEITGNLVSGYAADGAAISNITSTGTITINGGKIHNNYGERLGSAIRVSNGKLNIYGGEIVKNLMPATKQGSNAEPAGAIYVDNTALNIKGNVTISGNEVANLNLANANQVINVTGSLTGGDVYLSALGRMNAGGELGTIADGTLGVKKIQRDVTTDKPVSTSATKSGNKLIWDNETVIYVGANGKDTDNGTKASPFKTLKKAYETVADGGTIHVIGTVPVNEGITVA